MAKCEQDKMHHPTTQLLSHSTTQPLNHYTKLHTTRQPLSQTNEKCVPSCHAHFWLPPS